ncbi:hypothetical protein FZI56_13335 [Cronobacter sakazakii]|nr:hypothetical protein FZI56_13335 [Cronobacter sakazakii]
MSGWRSEKVSTIREEFDEINDSMKGSSSRMKNKVGAQKGAFIKMKQENMYIYQRILVVSYVPIIAPLTLLTLLTLVVLIITLFNVFSCKVCPRF